MEKAIVKFAEAFLDLLYFYKNHQANYYDKRKLSKIISTLEELLIELIHEGQI